jgi:hypothetical protein
MSVETKIIHATASADKARDALMTSVDAIEE